MPRLEYVPALCQEIRDRAARLAADTETTTANIRAKSPANHKRRVRTAGSSGISETVALAKEDLFCRKAPA